MAVKRIPDPTGLLGDRVTVRFDEPSVDGGASEGAALREILFANAPEGRIAALRKHPELAERADALLSHFQKKGCDDPFWLDLAGAEKRALYLAALPRLMRDTKRQAGTRAPRGSRMPELDAWIERQLGRQPHASAEELWNSIGESRELWRDGDRVYESLPDGRIREAGFAGFQRRVTSARKHIRS